MSWPHPVISIPSKFSYCRWRCSDKPDIPVGLIHKKEKLVPMHPRLRDMLLEEKNRLGNYFDPDRHVIAFTKWTLTHYFKKAMKRAGVDKPGAVHILRHTAATKLLEAGANIREVQEFLGHSSITTTQIYTHIVQENLENAVLRAFN